VSDQPERREPPPLAREQQRIISQMLRLRNQLTIAVSSIQESVVLLNELAENVKVTLTDLSQLVSQGKSKGKGKKEVK